MKRLERFFAAIDTREDTPFLLLIALVMWLAFLWNAACYGAGWCRWHDPRCAVDVNGINPLTGTWQAPTGVSCSLDFRFGGWEAAA